MYYEWTIWMHPIVLKLVWPQAFWSLSSLALFSLQVPSLLDFEHKSWNVTMTCPILSVNESTSNKQRQMDLELLCLAFIVILELVHILLKFLDLCLCSHLLRSLYRYFNLSNRLLELFDLYANLNKIMVKCFCHNRNSNEVRWRGTD